MNSAMIAQLVVAGVSAVAGYLVRHYNLLGTSSSPSTPATPVAVPVAKPVVAPVVPVAPVAPASSSAPFLNLLLQDLAQNMGVTAPATSAPVVQSLETVLENLIGQYAQGRIQSLTASPSASGTSAVPTVAAPAAPSPVAAGS